MITDHLPALPAPSRRHPLSRETKRSLYQGGLIALGAAITLGGSVAIGTDLRLGIIYIAALLGVMVALWIAVRPRVGVLLLIAFTYLNLSDLLEVYFGIPSINKPLVGLIFVSVLTNRVVLQRKPISFSMPVLIMFLYGMVTLISVVVATDVDRHSLAFSNWIKDFALLLIIMQFGDKENVWKKMQWVILLCAILLAVISCYQTLAKDYDNVFFGLGKSGVHEITFGFDSPRVTGPLDDPNYYALMLLMVLPIGVYRVMTERNPLLRLVAAVGSMLIMATIVFTYSRSAFVAVLITGALIVRDRKLNPYKIVGAAVVIVGILSQVLPAKYVDRLLTLQDFIPGDVPTQTDASFRGRSSEAIIAVQMFLDSPILGVGLNNYETHYLEYSYKLGLDNRFESREAHSLYLEVAAESGILGILSFGGMLILVFATMNRAIRQLTAIQRQDLVPWISGIKYGFVGYLIGSIFLHNGYPRYLWLILALCVSCQIVAETLTRQYQQAMKQAREDQQTVYIAPDLVPLESEVA